MDGRPSNLTTDHLIYESLHWPSVCIYKRFVAIFVGGVNRSSEKCGCFLKEVLGSQKPQWSSELPPLRRISGASIAMAADCLYSSIVSSGKDAIKDRSRKVLSGRIEIGRNSPAESPPPIAVINLHPDT